MVPFVPCLRENTQRAFLLRVSSANPLWGHIRCHIDTRLFCPSFLCLECAGGAPCIPWGAKNRYIAKPGGRRRRSPQFANGTAPPSLWQRQSLSEDKEPRPPAQRNRQQSATARWRSSWIFQKPKWLIGQSIIYIYISTICIYR